MAALAVGQGPGLRGGSSEITACGGPGRAAPVNVCSAIAGAQVIPRPPGPMKHGGSVIAFIEDPDGYKIELIERK